MGIIIITRLLRIVGVELRRESHRDCHLNQEDKSMQERLFQHGQADGLWVSHSSSKNNNIDSEEGKKFA